MADTAARRRVLRRLLAGGTMTSQAQLVSLLAEAGHPVTQATVSRDLAAVGAVKVSQEDGSAHYRLGAGDRAAGNDGLARALREFMTEVSAAGHLAVVKTPPGAAQVVAGALDEAELAGVLGTVAGDDTVLVVVERRGAELARRLEKIAQ